MADKLKSKVQTVAILGASDNPERFAYKAFFLLRQFGHHPLPVTPKFKEFEGVPAVAKLGQLKAPIDTLTVYVGPQISSGLTGEILALHPKRVIFNPGTENPELQTALEAAGIETLEACTLVMLRAGQF